MKVVLRGRGDFEEWRGLARAGLSAGVRPEAIEWLSAEAATWDLFADAPTAPPETDLPLTVPRDFVTLAQSVICHADPARFGLLYRLLWRLQTERHLMRITSDADVARAHLMARSVGRDSHKMKAFVRFKEIPVDGTDRRQFLAWFEPDHFIVARTAGFFQRRFTDMDWVIATPKGSATWDGHTLRVDDEPARNPKLEDETDALWRTYFSHIFNPARLKVKMMQTEMPKKYWKNLPEADLIPDLIAGAEHRVQAMAERQPTQPSRTHHSIHKQKP